LQNRKLSSWIESLIFLAVGEFQMSGNGSLKMFPMGIFNQAAQQTNTLPDGDKWALLKG
jgi:hypothetical protein